MSLRIVMLSSFAPPVKPEMRDVAHVGPVSSNAVLEMSLNGGHGRGWGEAPPFLLRSITLRVYTELGLVLLNK